MVQNIIKEYKNGRIDAKEYGEKMFKSYEGLMEFSDLIKNSIVKKIEITEEKVIIVIDNNCKEIKMVIHPLDSTAVPVEIMSFGEYEPKELDMTLNLLRMLDAESTIFDVGANLGWYTINILKDMPSRKVYSFEPVKDNFLKLKENLDINNLNSDDIFNIGFYDENKTMEFFYDVTGTGASSLANLRERNATKKIKCKFEKMDNFIEKNDIERLDFIKCDVEGSELFVYKGGIESIERFKPIIFSEILRKWSAKFDYHPNDIINLLRNIEYKCFVISGKKLKEIEIINEDTIETNYFFLHKNKHKDIIEQFIDCNLD